MSYWTAIFELPQPPQVRFSGTREQLVELVRAFVASIAGRAGAYANIADGIKVRAGMVALACIQEAFVAKADGGTGEDGIRWKELSKRTIAGRRIGPGDVGPLKDLGITQRQFGYGARRQTAASLDVRGRLKRAFLTDAEDLRWRKIFGTRKAMLMVKHGLSSAEAGARAAKIAWATLKSEGAKTKLEVLGNRKVQIGRDTGRLLSSLSPGTPDPAHWNLLAVPAEVADRILHTDAGGVIVGTNVEYAGKFHAVRPLWPATLPDVWNERIAAATRGGIVDGILLAVERGAL